MEDLDFQYINSDFFNLLKSIEENLKRAPPKSKFSRVSNPLINTYFAIAQNYFQTILFICKSKESVLALSLFVTPLTRSILEILQIIIYLLDDLDNKIVFFSKVAHREEKREIKKYEEKYDGNPIWEAWLSERRIALKNLEDAIEEDYDLQPSLNWDENEERFLSPSQIVKTFKDKETDLYNFLVYLNDIWYRELSLYSHSEPIAVFKLGAFLKSKNTDLLQNFQNNQIWLCLIFVLCIASEIEIKMDYGLKPRITYLWTWFINSSDYAKEFYEMRYQKLLND